MPLGLFAAGEYPGRETLNAVLEQAKNTFDKDKVFVKDR
jgi:hypothetical protein